VQNLQALLLSRIQFLFFDLGLFTVQGYQRGCPWKWDGGKHQKQNKNNTPFQAILEIFANFTEWNEGLAPLLASLEEVFS
jgi:hypothetical protein